jgi:hypothetical protein
MPLVRPLALVLLLATPALAQRPPKVQKFDFDNDVVEAGRPLPQLEVVGSATRGRHPSLIRVRTTFVPELMKSAENR